MLHETTVLGKFLHKKIERGARCFRFRWCLRYDKLQRRLIQVDWLIGQLHDSFHRPLSHWDDPAFHWKFRPWAVWLNISYTKWWSHAVNNSGKCAYSQHNITCFDRAKLYPADAAHINIRFRSFSVFGEAFEHVTSFHSQS